MATKETTNSKDTAPETNKDQTNETTASQDATFKPWPVIMRVANKRRPYNPDDFKKEYFIADISLAVPLAVGTAVKLMPMIQHILMNGRCM